MKTIEQIESELNESIPRDQISQRSGGGGKSLSYLEGWLVIDRLNKVFGPLNWDKEIVEIKELTGGKFPAYLAKVRLTVRPPITSGEDNKKIYSWDRYCQKEAYGYGSDKSANNPHELAIKEAVTDALKVAAKDLGMSMGLALYDKTQEFVEDAPTPKKGDMTSKEGTSNKRSLIVSTAQAAVAKKHITKEGILKYLKSDKSSVSDAIETLLDKEVDSVLTYMQGVLNDKQ